MVRLTKIYTRGGDAGKTSLGDGTRVSKAHVRIAAFGSVDELNAVLGVVRLQRGVSQRDQTLLAEIQNDLFDLGADLCVPDRAGAAPRLRVTATHVSALEVAIDARNAKLAPLDSFVLPGGTALATWLHVARTVCRRAELGVVHMQEAQETCGEHVLPYLNRLSDLLFVMARWANRRGRGDVLWKPGGRRVQRPRR